MFTDHYSLSNASPAILVEVALKKFPKGNSLIFVTETFKDLSNYQEIFHFYNPSVPVFLFPAFDSLPYDRISPSAEVMAQRIFTLKAICTHQQAKKPFILVTTPLGILQKVRQPDILHKASITVAPNKKVPLEKLSRFLSLNGYIRTPTVRETGEFSVRGGIVDIFPAGMEKPIRIDFFGEIIEKIKSFDPATQISLDVLEQFELSPISEIILNKTTLLHFKEHYTLLQDGTIPKEDPFFEKIMNRLPVQGMEAFLPLFDSHLTDIVSLMKKADVIFDSKASGAMDEAIKDIWEYYTHHGLHQKLVPPKDVYLTEDPDSDWKEIFKNHPCSFASQHNLPEGDNVISLNVKPARNFISMRKMPNINLFEETVKIAKKAIQEKKTVLFTSPSLGARDRFTEGLEEHGLEGGKLITSYKEVTPKQIHYAVLPLESGFEKEECLCITEEDIFGAKVKQRRRKSKDMGKMLLESQSFGVGDYIVHADHGIGQYKAIETVTVDKISHDCVLLEYYGGDRLYVLVENIDLLTRYGSEDIGVQCDKLGSSAWQSRKAKLKKRLLDIADHLIKIAAEREVQKGEIVTPIEDLYHDFCARFPYEETEDQLEAIHAVTEDLASGKPMDRLVCGDVGFGKTEVAIRAAFLAAAAGMQVAIIVPTTLLARQHYKNFIARFEGQPFSVTCLSRMISPKKSEEIRNFLEKGTLDIVIGTHALLSDKVKFKNLGLLIIDEEQHFGVTHKEKLKNLKSNIHILTLTATPIPRTLQLSMTGVRDLSLIATPPVDRLAIKTYVSVFDKNVIREALLREKYRGGQAFFVVPRIKDIEGVSRYLMDHIPEMTFISAHGKLPMKELDQRMNDFYDRKYDILLATTIIESGIDIPTANTMIVWRADMFGLAQLYQIRGRIGRSKQRAFAYLTTEKDRLRDTAEKRLKVLESLDHLGAGFTLASHDMDIRGAGNLLGQEQSGHIKEVGYELYQEMLQQALTALKSKGEEAPLEDNKSPQINIGLSALIPENYITDQSVRFGIYRRIAELEGREAIDSFATELIDRFGKLPSEVKNLLSIIELKNLAKKAHISKVEAGEKGIVMTFHNNHYPTPEKLLQWIDSQKNVKLGQDHRLKITLTMPKVIDRFKACVGFLRVLEVT